MLSNVTWDGREGEGSGSGWPSAAHVMCMGARGRFDRDAERRQMRIAIPLHSWGPGWSHDRRPQWSIAADRERSSTASGSVGVGVIIAGSQGRRPPSHYQLALQRRYSTCARRITLHHLTTHVRVTPPGLLLLAATAALSWPSSPASLLLLQSPPP